MPDRLRFAFATRTDEAELRRLLRDNPMRGAITVGFTHEPDYFRGMDLAGGTDRTLLARENGRLVAAGRCTTRACWLNGAVRRVAYLGELRLDASVQGRWDILRGGYDFFGAAYARDPADFCFTSIVADNTRARRLFERGLRGLPRYQLIGEYLTRLIPSGNQPGPSPFTFITGAQLPPEQLIAFLNETGRRHHLAAHWTPEALASLSVHGLRRDDIIVAMEGETIAACAGLWDQQSFRQVRIQAYHPLLAAGRPLLNLLAPALGQPRLPDVGSTLNQALLTPFACRLETTGVLPALIRFVRHMARRRGLACVALGGPTDDPLLNRLPGRRYRSRLYRVDWPGVPSAVSALDAWPCIPEIGLL
jgi:hypothetical protein